MKRTLALLLSALLLLPGCGSAREEAAPVSDEVQETAAETENDAEGSVEEASDAEVSGADTAAQAPAADGDSNVLVIYFSRPGEQYTVGVIEEGNTAIVAGMVAEETGADVFEVLPADDHYPTTYEALTEVAMQEQTDGARPAFAGELPDLSGYDTIFIGSPVWWGDWPMIMYTLFESTDFSGKTLIPFSTHEGSGLSGFDRKLGEKAEGAVIGKGLAVRGNDAQNKRDEVRETVREWLAELGF